jgi:DNA repair photolyase
MSFRGWEKDLLTLQDGKVVEAICPVIVSASRATDIPAFFSKWFFNRLRSGYMRWMNPFNANQIQYVSFSRMRVIVFWSKNPKPILPYLSELDDAGINYYFQFTLNDYGAEGIEPNVPSLNERVEVFKRLADKVGPERVIWRFDPLILSNSLTVDELLRRITLIASMLKGATQKLVISFADINMYQKVHNNLSRQPQEYREFTTDQMMSFVESLVILNKEWGLEIATCSEKVDLMKYGIKHSHCIDDKLMIKLFKDDIELMSFLGYEPDQLKLFSGAELSDLKDKGQRKECGCIISKDIGKYNTCNHLCAYCYANVSPKAVENSLCKYDPDSESLISS